VQNNARVAIPLLVTFFTCALIVLWRTLAVDSRFRLSVLVLTVGFCLALVIVAVDVDVEAPDFVASLIWTIGVMETFVGVIAFLTILEVLVRRIRAKRTKSAEPNTWTIFISRTGMVIVALTMGSAAYGAIVNAMAFFLLSKLMPHHLVSEDRFDRFQELYLTNIGYHLAQMEFINWLTTFGIGAFLVTGIGYQLIRISTSGDGWIPRGYYIQNVLNFFLWLSLFGFLIVFLCYLADKEGWLDLLNCAGKAYCEIFGIRLAPFEIYLVSATRILPFLLPIFLSSLRVGLNVAADVLLYILPSEFPLSIRVPASSRLAVLLNHLQNESPKDHFTTCS
jgi:hypothetical protein